MKRFKYFLSTMLVLVSLVCFSCFDSGSSDGDGTDDTGASGIVKSTKLYDNNDTFLGYCIPSGSSIMVLSPNGYYYTLNWDGSLTGSVYFTEQNLEGTPFILSQICYFGKTIISVSNQFYTMRDIDSYGNASIDDTTITSYKSINNYGTVTNHASGGAVSRPTLKSLALKTITKAEAGIPATIALPLKISFE